MSLNINNESTNLRKSQQKRYGNLMIDTTIKEEKGVIDLKQPNIAAVVPPKRSKNLSIRSTIDTKSSTTIMRGQKVSINSKTQNLSKLLIALDWEVTSRGTSELELDTSLFMVYVNGKTAEENFIFYGNPRSGEGAILIGGDYNSGLKAAYDECIELNLNSVKINIEKLAITVTIFEGEKRNQNFSQLSNAYLRIIDAETKREVFSYRFDEGLKVQTAVVVAEIYRYKNEWKINPIGNGFTGGLKALCSNYGIETE